MQNPAEEEKLSSTARFENRETLSHLEYFDSRGPLVKSDVHILMFSLPEIRKNKTAAARIMIT